MSLSLLLLLEQVLGQCPLAVWLLLCLLQPLCPHHLHLGLLPLLLPRSCLLHLQGMSLLTWTSCLSRMILLMMGLEVYMMTCPSLLRGTLLPHWHLPPLFLLLLLLLSAHLCPALPEPPFHFHLLGTFLCCPGQALFLHPHPHPWAMTHLFIIIP